MARQAGGSGGSTHRPEIRQSHRGDPTRRNSHRDGLLSVILTTTAYSPTGSWSLMRAASRRSSAVSGVSFRSREARRSRSASRAAAAAAAFLPAWEGPATRGQMTRGLITAVGDTGAAAVITSPAAAVYCGSEGSIEQCTAELCTNEKPASAGFHKRTSSETKARLPF